MLEIHIALDEWAVDVLEKELERLNNGWSLEEYIRRVVMADARNIRDKAPDLKEQQ